MYKSTLSTIILLATTACAPESITMEYIHDADGKGMAFQYNNDTADPVKIEGVIIEPGAKAILRTSQTPMRCLDEGPRCPILRLPQTTEISTPEGNRTVSLYGVP